MKKRNIRILDIGQTYKDIISLISVKQKKASKW